MAPAHFAPGWFSRRAAMLLLLFSAVVVSLPVPLAADPFTPGNLLVTYNNRLFEFTPGGVKVQVVLVPYPSDPRPPDEIVRGVLCDVTSDAVLINGAYLTTYSPLAGGVWTHHACNWWDLSASIGRSGQWLYASGGGGVYGTLLEEINRFDSDGGYACEQFYPGTRYHDMSVGLDGLLYALLGHNLLQVFDPVTLEMIRTVDLEFDVNVFDVDEGGQIYGVSGLLFSKFDPNGTRLAYAQLPLTLVESDLEISENGTVAIGYAYGQVVLTSTSFGTPLVFRVGSAPGYNNVYVGFVAGEPPVPTFVTYFDASAVGTAVEVRWDLQTTEDIRELKVLRKADGDDWRTVYVARFDELDRRVFEDKTVEPGCRYQYALVVTEADGQEIRSAVADVVTPGAVMALQQNVPNPFNPATTIAYSVAVPARVKLGIYDAAGHLVAVLVDEVLAAGTHEAVWNGNSGDGTPAASGVYFYRLESGGRTLTKKLLLLK
ncbi:MAG: FlgD immunoglobulin-like domain containing protein [Candidatus Latescibacterota bacterium]|jgi:hypothetical protein